MGLLGHYSFKLTGEENLLVAIFLRALRDHLGATMRERIKQHDRRSAAFYFLSNETDYGTFNHFCDHFMFDKKRLLNMIESGEVGHLLFSAAGEI